jgi:hypothetical protein
MLSNADNVSDQEKEGEASGFEQREGSMGPPPLPQTKRRKSRDSEGNVFPNAPSA